MTTDRNPEYLRSLVQELRKLPKETGWVEFKENFAEPEEIGEYISALSNSAALAGKMSAYLLWGIHNDTHALVGTDFSPSSKKVGNEELENWLLHLLSPRIQFQFYPVEVDGVHVILLEISRAVQKPVQFKGQEHIRIGSYKKKLKDFPEKEKALWRTFDQTPFESLFTSENIPADELLKLLDYPAYFEMLSRPLPNQKEGILDALSGDEMITRNETGNWNITNLGAVLLAKKLSDFHGLKRKSIRVIFYKENNRVETIREQEGVKGYANGFEGLIGFINGMIPSNEVMGKALRKTVPMYPDVAVRELVANALIHQDFSITGTGPMVEIFSDRMEVSNPGTPIVDTRRFVDTPPRSRNEKLASFMRRIGVCEERGSGVDKVVFQTEYYQLPAPIFETRGGSTCAVLFAHRPLSKMDKGDRVRACYLHACLKYVNREYLTNTSIRQRFGIEDQNIASASRLIKEAVDSKMIIPYDSDAAPKLMKYVPFWAGEIENKGPDNT